MPALLKAGDGRKGLVRTLHSMGTRQAKGL